MAGDTSSPVAPKVMSSRLLTMKFMQRAAASPISSPPSTPEESPSKRQKTVHSSPSRFNVDALTDHRAIQAALAEEETKRQAALERQENEAGDTRWVLNFEAEKDAFLSRTTALRVVQAGYPNLDYSLPLRDKYTDSGFIFEDKPIIVGRKSFGKFNRIMEKQQDPSKYDSLESDSEEGSEEIKDEFEDQNEEDPTGANALIRASQQEAVQRAKAELKAKKRAEKAESVRLAEARKKKEVKLNTRTSLTGRQEPVRACHKCGELDHLQKDCPQNKRSYDDNDDGPPRKWRKSR